MEEERVEEFLMAFVEWAKSRPDVLGVALVGSYARGEARPDSDVDLVIIASHAAHYLSDAGWISRFGEAVRYETEDYGLVASVRAWYRDGLEVEYGWTDQRWAALPLDEGTRQVIEGGMRVLFERGNLLSRHQKRGS